MVNLQGKESAALKTIQQSLNNNLNIIASDSRLKTITDKIADSRYRIKDLSIITSNKVTFLDVIIGRLFTIPQIDNAGIVLVFDYQTDALLTTINTGATQNSYTILSDDTYIYIPKCTHLNNQKWVYVQRYNKCTLAYVDEVLIYQYLGEQSNSAGIFALVENGSFLYAASIESTDSGNKHKIRKINKSNLTTASYVEDLASYSLVKGTNGFYSLGSGNTTYPNRVIYYDWDLNIIQVFPQTTLTTNIFRCCVEKDGYLYACNDSGIIVKYDIATNSIVAQKSTGEATAFKNIFIAKDIIVVQQNLGVIRLFDLSLNFIKSWDYYNTSTQGGAFFVDKNNTLWSQNRSTTNIIKKQIIDMTKDII